MTGALSSGRIQPPFEVSCFCYVEEEQAALYDDLVTLEELTCPKQNSFRLDCLLLILLEDYRGGGTTRLQGRFRLTSTSKLQAALRRPVCGTVLRLFTVPPRCISVSIQMQVAVGTGSDYQIRLSRVLCLHSSGRLLRSRFKFGVGVEEPSHSRIILNMTPLIW